jgi:hypothetical protein
MKLLSELVGRASERIPALGSPHEFDYDSTVSELQLITARISEIIAGL